MKVLLRNTRTGFYMNSGEWTEHVEEARDFRFSAEAVKYAADHRLGNVEVVFSFSDRQYDFSSGEMEFPRG